MKFHTGRYVPRPGAVVHQCASRNPTVLERKFTSIQLEWQEEMQS